MSLYHGFDMQFRKLQESFKKIQEVSVEEHKDSRIKESGEYLAANVEGMFKKAYELMKKVEMIYDSNPETIEQQMETHKVLMAMEELHQLIFDNPGEL